MSAIERVRPSDPRVPVAPQLAMRVAILGFLAMVMFGLIFFRLWYLQILTGEQYVHQANVNRVRDLPIAAPRGEILDREGKSIVTSRTTNAVQVVPRELPPAVAEQAAAYHKSLAAAEVVRLAAVEALRRFQSTHPAIAHRSTAAERRELHRLEAAAAPVQVPVPALPASAVAVRRLFDRLGRLLLLSPQTIDERVVQGMSATPYADVTVKTDAGQGPLTVLAERQSEFPGVVQQPVAIRNYPFGEMAAQVLGHVDEISGEELKMKAFRGVAQGTVVGQEGLEYYYDRYLRGKAGVQRVEVDASGNPIPSRLTPTLPVAGHSLKLSISLPLQQESEKALLQGIENARAGGKPAEAGAFVALDPRSGQVLAMGSYPSVDPNKFAKPLTPAEYNALVGGGSKRLIDRAAGEAYPTGSTFKPIVAMAALENGVLTPEEGLGPGPCISVGTEQFCNAGHADYGAVPLVQALKVSSDTYFFEAGERANSHGRVIQAEAEKLGIGHETGIDLPSELKGVIPDAKWRQRQNELELSCEKREHKSSCGIVAEPEKPWTVGDNMHLAVGQGDLLTDPLQMAVAYSTLANAYMNGGAGTVVVPHLGLEIDEITGGLVQSLSTARSARHVHLNYNDLSLVMEGIHEAASQPGGTSADVWNGWNQSANPVYGKTGTAERYGKEDQSWYMAYIADPKRPVVIAVTVEQGGFGAETAAPIARLMASKWFNRPLKFVTGSSHTL